MTFHMRDHALFHFGEVFRKRSVILCRNVFQMVRTVIYCIFEAMTYLMNDLQFLLAMMRTALSHI